MLQRSTKDLRGDRIEATDGRIGALVDVYFDDVQWAVRSGRRYGRLAFRAQAADLAGQSAGGVAFVAGARAPQGLVAVLAFAAGRGGNPLRHPGVSCALEPLARVFAQLGKRVKVPVLFHYAENDVFFNARTSRLWFERFTRGGARAEYVLQPPVGENGHCVFSDDWGARYWMPAVERFLRKHGVPFDAMPA